MARERLAISLNPPPNRTRHMPGQLASASIVAMTHPSFEPSLSWRPSQTSSFLPKQCPVFEGRRKGCRGRAGACISAPLHETARAANRMGRGGTAFLQGEETNVEARWCAHSRPPLETARAPYRYHGCSAAFASRWCDAKASHGRNQWRRVPAGGKDGRDRHHPPNGANR